MANNQKKNPISEFIKAQADIIRLALIVILALAGFLLHKDVLLRISLIAAVYNFAALWYGLRKAKDERISSHLYLAAYITLLAVFIILGTMGSLYKNQFIQNIDVLLYTRIIAWFIGFSYALTYSIIKRLF
jgi:hypothetical protein